jgi:phosphoribosylanthranilate isomerase
VALKVKICGITNLEDALKAVDLGADALGFIFYRKSPRYVTPRVAKLIINRLPSFINRIGVFVNERESEVKRIASYCGLDTLQFHGSESSSYCKKFKGYRIIKAFRINDKIDIENISKYKVDAYLLDTYKRGIPGGTGKVFNWDLLNKIRRFKRRIILSGGLNPENVKMAIRKVNPYAIDVSSSLEKRAGKKDHRLMELFFQSVNSTRL